MDPVVVITGGFVLVDGARITNPAARVRADAAVRVLKAKTLRGTHKLRGALDAFDADVRGVVALDLGAAAGGFTQALLDAGAARVYAVDAGSGQLRGWLRSDPRVVALEHTNMGTLGPRHILEPVNVVTMDLSYLAVADALPQLDRRLLAPRAHLVALVKPTYELHAGVLAAEPNHVEAAIASAVRALRREGWDVQRSVLSSVTGSKGAVEAFVHAIAREQRWNGTVPRNGERNV
jgi:23S rRNA (cytidine1920-2'-O)/16S rRNA (cytidine1409-2'-O)-methyltransferase